MITSEYKSYEKALCFALILQLIGIITFYNFYLDNGYLASPFIGDKYDTFMDFFNGMYWAFDDGRYTEWKSVYPPINFIFFELAKVLDADFVKEVLINSMGPPGLRESNILVFLIVFMYLFLPALLMNYRYWSGFTLIQKTLIYLIYIMSIPFLFGFERGNTIILALPFLGILIGGGRIRALLSLAILINIKPYFVLLAYGYLCKHDLRNFMKVILLSGFIFVSSGILLGDENCLLMISNIIGFSENDQLFSVTELLSVSSSVSAQAQLLKTETFISSGFIKKLYFTPEILFNAISLIKWLAVIFAFYSMSVNGKRLPIALIFSFILILITNISNSVGGYSLLIYLAIFPLLPKLKQSGYIYFLIFLMFSTLPDWITIFNQTIHNSGSESWLLGESTDNVIWTLGIGTIIRPWVNLFLLVLLSIQFFSLNKETELKRGCIRW